LEAEVASRGGTFAFCDTDSLAIVAGEDCPAEIPVLNRSSIAEIIDKFDRLNPYDRTLVPHMLKDEYPDIPTLRCWAVSAKRYVLFSVTSEGALKIEKASESGLGGVIGRTENEKTGDLARAIWARILEIELGGKFKIPQTSASEFDVAVRRKLPLAQPRILNNKGFRKFNRRRKYTAQIKPFGFIQALVPAIDADQDIQPIAPFESDARRTRNLPWVDLHTGEDVAVDWTGSGYAGTFQPMTLAEYVERFRNHPEAKAADCDGNPSVADTKGLLFRLRIMADKPDRIGKEVDRLEEDDGTDLLEDGPFVYDEKPDKRKEQAAGFEKARLFLETFRPKRRLCDYLKVTPRRLRDVLKRMAYPRSALRRAIIQLAASFVGREVK
jgi:hypothetical protein